MKSETEKNFHPGTFDPKEFYKRNIRGTEIPVGIKIEPLEQEEILEPSREDIESFLEGETEWIRTQIEEQERYIELQARNVEKGLATQEEGEKEIRAVREKIQDLENLVEDEKLKIRTKIEELDSLSIEDRENRFEENAKDIKVIRQVLDYLIDSKGDSVKPFAKKLLEDLKNFQQENRIIEFLKKSKSRGEIKTEEIATTACG